MGCPRCGYKDVDVEEAAKHVREFLMGVPELHRRAFQKVFRSIRLVSDEYDPTDESKFLERLSYAGIDSRAALLMIQAFLDDPQFWTKLRYRIDRKLPYLAEAVVSAILRDRRVTRVRRAS